MQLRSRKQNLIRLFEKMQVYQFEQIDPDKPLDSHVRALTEEDITRLISVLGFFMDWIITYFIMPVA